MLFGSVCDCRVCREPFQRKVLYGLTAAQTDKRRCLYGKEARRRFCILKRNRHDRHPRVATASALEDVWHYSSHDRGSRGLKAVPPAASAASSKTFGHVHGNSRYASSRPPKLQRLSGDSLCANNVCPVRSGPLLFKTLCKMRQARELHIYTYDENVCCIIEGQPTPQRTWYCVSDNTHRFEYKTAVGQLL